MAICIIPARGGSKRILRKNLKDFCGLPIISYSIQNAQNSGIFSEIIISSDDFEILEYGAKLGAKPLQRPAHLSDDFCGTREVILHAISTLNSKNEIICCLYATAPLLDSNTLKEAYTIAKGAKDCYCFSATAFETSPFRGFYIENGKNSMLFKEHFNKRSQDLKTIYHDAGQFYFAYASTWKNKENIFEDSISFILPQTKVQDIDTLEDWEIAELKFKALKATGN